MKFEEDSANYDNMHTDAILTRRDFLKLSALAGGATAVTLYGLNGGALDAVHAEDDGTDAVEGEYEGFSGCCVNCIGGCSHKVTVRNGMVVNVTANPTVDKRYTRVCLRGLSNPQRMRQADRLKYPMKRAGPRGSGDWQRISWEEALDEIAAKIEDEMQYTGSQRGILWGMGSVTFYQVLHGIFGFMKMLMNVGGTLPMAPNVLDMGLMIGVGSRLGGLGGTISAIVPDSLTNLISPVIGDLYGLLNKTAGPTILNSLGVRGLMYIGVPNGCNHEDWKKSKYMIFWGSNLTQSMLHESHFVWDAQKAGMKVCVIDPRFSGMAAKADLWVPVKAGSDVIFGLSLINVIINENLYDEHFVKEHTVGTFLVKNRDGKFLRLIDVPLVGGVGNYWERDDASRLVLPAGVPSRPALFGEFSTLSGTCRPAFQLLKDIADEWPPEKAADACGISADLIRQVAHEFATEKPAGFHLGLGCDRYSTADAVGQLHVILLALTGNFGKEGCTGLGIGINELAGGLFNPTIIAEIAAQLPSIMGLLLPQNVSSVAEGLAGVSLLHFDSPMQEWLEEGNCRFIYNTGSNFLLNQFPNRVRWVRALEKVELIATADLFFTATAEMSDIVLPVAHWYEEWDISFGLHPHIVLHEKLVEPPWECKSDWWIYCQLGKRLGFGEEFIEDEEENIRRLLGPKWDKMREQGMLYMGSSEPYIPYKNLTFGTPSGRIHIYNDELTDLRKELPYARWPIEAGPNSPEAANYPLIYMTQHGNYRVHSTFANVPWIREIIPEPLCEMNYIDAHDRDIADNDIVRIWNDRGYVAMRARVNEGVGPGTIVIQQGWWPKDYLAGHHQNLTHDKVDPLTRNLNFSDNRVEVEKISDVKLRELQRSDATLTPYIEKVRRSNGKMEEITASGRRMM